IKTDMDVPLDLEKARVQSPDNSALRALLVELEFHTLARQIDAPEDTAPAKNESAPEAARSTVSRSRESETVATAKALEKAVASAKKAGRVAIAIHTSPQPGAPYPLDPLRSTIVGVAMGLD